MKKTITITTHDAVEAVHQLVTLYEDVKNDTYKEIIVTMEVKE